MKSLMNYIKSIFKNDNAVFEMAYSREDFIKKADSKYTVNIIENYALIYYAEHCTDASRYKNIVNHWKGELLALIDDVQTMKPKNNNKKTAYKAFEYIWKEKREYDNSPHSIIKIFIKKFKEENIHSDDEVNLEIANSFIDNIDELIYELIYGNYESAELYVNSI